MSLNEMSQFLNQLNEIMGDHPNIKAAVDSIMSGAQAHDAASAIFGLSNDEMMRKTLENEDMFKDRIESTNISDMTDMLMEDISKLESHVKSLGLEDMIPLSQGVTTPSLVFESDAIEPLDGNDDVDDDYQPEIESVDE